MRVREAREHTSGDIFRCTIGSVDGDRGRDLPAWMFDRAVCGLVRSLASPIVDMQALVRLRAFLEDALGLTRPDAAASVGVRSGASMGSHDPELGEKLMPQPQTPHRRRRHPRLDQFDLFDAARRRRSRGARLAKRRSRGARLEGPARDGAPGHHNGVDAVDGRSPTRQRRLPGREARHDERLTRSACIHLTRKAILYVRQSSPHQVLHNPRKSELAVCHA